MAKKKIVVDKENDKVYLNGTAVRNRVDYDAIDDYYLNVIEYFANGKTNGTSHLSNIMQKTFKAAETNIDKSSTMALQTAKMYNELLKDTQAYFDSKKAADKDYARFLLREMLFPWQSKVYDSKSDKKTMLAGRRSGKSFCIVENALKHSLQEPLNINGVTRPRQAMIMGLTVDKTAAIYWDNIKSAIEKCHIPTKKIDNSSYTVYFPNGNKLFLYGNNSKAEREKLRGFDLSFCAIDECQSQQNLLYIYEGIVGPQLQGTAGEIILAGTAPLSAGTYWEQSILSDEWEHFHATMEDNPSIPNHKDALKDVLEKNHWTEDNITFRREYKGELAYDNNLLIYPSYHTHKIIPPDFHPKYLYIGCDLGWVDRSAVIPLLIDENGQGYVVSEWQRDHVDDTTIYNQVKAVRDSLKEKYALAAEDIHIVGDTNEPNMTNGFYNRGLSEWENALKPKVEYGRALLNEALSSGRIVIPENGPCEIDAKSAVYKFDQERGCVVYEEDKAIYHEDPMAALRYAYYNYFSTIECMRDK